MQKAVIMGVKHEGLILLISMVLLLKISSATFTEIYSVTIDDLPGVWRGVPEVRFDTGVDIPDFKRCQICLDDTYWNTNIADAICHYYGFKGSMIIKGDTIPSETNVFLDGYAVCNKIDKESGVPLECEFRELCDRIPTISCLLPWYEGCFSETDTNPFISDGAVAYLGGQSTNIQACAASCPGSPYLGLTSNQKCICGSTLGDRSLVGVCDVGCEGDDLQQCGGQNAISVYGANVIGQCGTDERVKLIPDQPYYITSPNFPDFSQSSTVCTWILTIDVDTAHNLEVIVTYEFGYSNSQQLRVSSETLEVEMTPQGSSGLQSLNNSPYSALKDNITVSFTPYRFDTGASFVAKFLLMSRGDSDSSSMSKDGGNGGNINKLDMYAAVVVVLTTLLMV